MDVFDAAVEAYRAGLCPLPAANDGSKRPAIPWKNAAPVDPAEHRGLYRGGVGFVCGAASGGLEMLELEGRAAGMLEDLLWQADMAGVPLAEIDTGYRERTPSGGLHWLYRVEGGVPGNTRLARGASGEMLIETRGEGGWTVAAPSNGSTHPTGRPWTLEQGGVGSIVTITADQHRALHALCRTFNRYAERPTLVEAPVRPVEARDTPVDRWQREVTWEDILGRHGWQLVMICGDEKRWRRPGKDLGSISAVTNHLGTDRLKVFSTSVTGFSPDETYSKFGAYTILEHGGDMHAAARHLARAYGDSLPVRAVSDILDVTSHEIPAPDDEDWVIPTYDLAQLMTEEDPGEDWLLEPFLIRGRSHALYAEAKTGKSLLALQAAIAVANGQRFLEGGRPEPGVVLYIDYEMTRSDLIQRLHAFGYQDHGRLHYTSAPPAYALDTAEGMWQLVKNVQERYRPDLVVIDTLAIATEGEEDKADTYRRLARTMGTLKTLGVTTLRIDHAGKDRERGMRGSSAKAADVDVVWRMDLTGDRRFRLTCERQRVGYVPASIELERQDDPLAFVEPAPLAWPAGVEAVARRLNDLEVSEHAGPSEARRAIGYTVDDFLLRAALRWRRR